MKPLLVAASLSAALITGAARADELRPVDAQHVSLGPISGIVYFTAQGSSDELVATLGAGNTLPCVRFETSLRVGQSVILSVPREPGKLAFRIRFERRGDQVFVIQDPIS